MSQKQYDWYVERIWDSGRRVGLSNVLMQACTDPEITNQEYAELRRQVALLTTDRDEARR